MAKYPFYLVVLLFWLSFSFETTSSLRTFQALPVLQRNGGFLEGKGTSLNDKGEYVIVAQHQQTSRENIPILNRDGSICQYLPVEDQFYWVLTKYFPNGVCQWVVKIRGSAMDSTVPISVSMNQEGEVALFGAVMEDHSTASSLISLENSDGTTFRNISGQYGVGFIAKYTADGFCLWSSEISVLDEPPSTAFKQKSFSVSITNNGEIFASGIFTGVAIDIKHTNGESFRTMTASGDNMFCIQILYNGTCSWAAYTQSASLSSASCVSNKGVITIGGSFANSNNFYIHDTFGNSTMVTPQTIGSFVSSFSPLEFLRWLFFVENGFIVALSGNDYEVSICGTFSQGSATFQSANGSTFQVLVNGGTTDSFVAKYYSMNGTGIAALRITGSRNDVVEDIAMNNLGEVFVIGDYYSSTLTFENPDGSFLTSITGQSSSSPDTFVAKYFSNASIDFVVNVAESDWDDGLDISVNNRNSMIVLAESYSPEIIVKIYNRSASINNTHPLGLPGKSIFIMELSPLKNPEENFVEELEIYTDAFDIIFSHEDISNDIIICPLEMIECSFGFFLSLNFENKLINGTIPPSIGNMTQIFYINMANNNLKGPIPSSFLSLKSAQEINLANNCLNGTIPNHFNEDQPLEKINLANNQLDGPIPVSLGNLRNLKEVYLDGNLLVGSIPDSVGSLTEIQILSLSNNLLSGELPESLYFLNSLLHLNLSKNELRGSISPSVGSLVMMQSLDLSENFLDGRLPRQIGLLGNLHELYFNNNLFTGCESIVIQNSNATCELQRNYLSCGCDLDQLPHQCTVDENNCTIALTSGSPTIPNDPDLGKNDDGDNLTLTLIACFSAFFCCSISGFVIFFVWRRQRVEPKSASISLNENCELEGKDEEEIQIQYDIFLSHKQSSAGTFASLLKNELIQKVPNLKMSTTKVTFMICRKMSKLQEISYY